MADVNVNKISIFGIEKGDWEKERELRSMQAELAESSADKEAQLLYGSSDKYGIYQLKDNPELRDFHFAGTTELLKKGILSDDFKEIQPENYNLVYTGELSDIHGQSQVEKLGAVYEKFNIDHPEDFKRHSLSVSDIVVLHENGENSAHFVDSFGFTELPDFMRELEDVKEQGFEKAEPEEMQDTSGHDVQKSEAEKQKAQEEQTEAQTEQKSPQAVYGHTLSYAIEHGEVQEYKASRTLDRECKAAVEETIWQNFDGMHLKHDIVKPLAEQYGSERMAFVLANTIQQESWDGRFSMDNKAWASEFPISENIVHGMDRNRELIVSSHPAVLDGFIDMFRREVLELEKELSAGQEEVQDTSGHDVQKPKTEQAEPEQTQAEQPEAEKSEPQTEQNEPEKSAKTLELEDMDDGDEIIDLGDEKDQVLAEMKKSLAGEQETELAFQIADRFISIQEIDGGYDYSIMGADYKEIDGGVYDNPDVSIREALDNIVEDLKKNSFDNGARGNISDNDELIPIDYDGLMEKVEAANRMEPQTQRNVVENFKAKTKELFHEISEMNPAEIEETIKYHMQEKMEEYAIDAEIIDIAIVGSRCRGLEQEGSDLDVVAELSTNEHEDNLFKAFNNDNGLSIGGIKVDINPITAQYTGTLETYLSQVEDSLEGIRKAREQEPKSIFSIRMNGEERFYENTSGLDAEALWKAYAECKQPFVEMEQYGKKIAIGDFAGIQQSEQLSFSIEFDVDKDEIVLSDGEHFEHKGLKETAKLPEMEIDGVMSEEMEAKIWEKRMPDLTPAEQLAVEIDRFSYHYDANLYHDSTRNMTENVSELHELIQQGDTEHLSTWLHEVISEGTVPEEAERAKELLEKLAEYKPLAKIEEMEEENCNMVDNVLNNGHEKFHKEKNKKEQDKPAARPSLKARLAEKKAQIAGQGKGQENAKKNRREM